MKLARTSTTTLLLALMATAPSAVSAQVLGEFFQTIFFGNDEDSKPQTSPSNTGSKVSKSAANEYVVASLTGNPITGPVFSNLDAYVTQTAAGDGRASLAGTQISEGKRAYKCMTDTGSGSRSFPFLDAVVESISYGVLYQMFDDPSNDIDVICGESARRRLSKNKESKTNLRGQQQQQQQQQQQERELQTVTAGVTANYPSLNAEQVYSGGKKNEALSTFLATQDFNNRTALVEMMDELNEQIVVYQTASQNTQVAGQIIYAIGEFISTAVPGGSVVIAEVDLDVGATVRGLGTFIQSVATATATNTVRRQRSLSKLGNHMSLVDSAEIEANYQNSYALVGELVSLRAKVDQLEARLRG